MPECPNALLSRIGWRGGQGREGAAVGRRFYSFAW